MFQPGMIRTFHKREGGLRGAVHGDREGRVGERPSRVLRQENSEAYRRGTWGCGYQYCSEVYYLSVIIHFGFNLELLILVEI